MMRDPVAQVVMRLERALGGSIHADRFVNNAIFKVPCPFAKESKLSIWIKTAVFDPSPEEVILAREPNTCTGPVIP